MQRLSLLCVCLLTTGGAIRLQTLVASLTSGGNVAPTMPGNDAPNEPNDELGMSALTSGIDQSSTGFAALSEMAASLYPGEEISPLCFTKAVEAWNNVQPTYGDPEQNRQNESHRNNKFRAELIRCVDEEGSNNLMVSEQARDAAASHFTVAIPAPPPSDPKDPEKDCCEDPAVVAAKEAARHVQDKV